MNRVALALLLLAPACIHRPTPNSNVLVVGVTSGPNNLDPRIGTDDVSAKASQLVFNNLMTLDDHLRVVPDLAERLDNPDPTTYLVTLRRGVKFHDGHELTSADVVYTFRSLLDPAFLSPRKGAYRMVKAIDARDETRRRALYADVQRIVAEEAPYISLWCKTNAAVARRDLTGIHILPTADFTFLKDVARESPRDARRAGF